MAKAAQTRWVCPNGHGGVMGPRRPRRDNLCRYCLECSRKAGRLVERMAPALLSERERKAAASARRREQKLAREAEAEARYYTVRVRDAAGREFDMRLDEELRRLARRVRGRKSKLARRGAIKLVIRRSDVGIQHGHAKPWSWEIVLTLPKGMHSWEDLQVLLLHELVHIYSLDDQPHGRGYRQHFAKAAPKAWPGIGRIPAAPKAHRQYALTQERLVARTRRLADDSRGG